jgi:hypothetical protein
VVPQAPFAPPNSALWSKISLFKHRKNNEQVDRHDTIIQHRCPEVWEASETIGDPKGYLGDYPHGPTSAFCTPKQRTVEPDFAIQTQEKQRTSRQTRYKSFSIAALRSQKHQKQLWTPQSVPRGLPPPVHNWTCTLHRPGPNFTT